MSIGPKMEIITVVARIDIRGIGSTPVKCVKQKNPCPDNAIDIREQSFEAQTEVAMNGYYKK